MKDERIQIEENYKSDLAENQLENISTNKNNIKLRLLSESDSKENHIQLDETNNLDTIIVDKNQLSNKNNSLIENGNSQVKKFHSNFSEVKNGRSSKSIVENPGKRNFKGEANEVTENSSSLNENFRSTKFIINFGGNEDKNKESENLNNELGSEGSLIKEKDEAVMNPNENYSKEIPKDNSQVSNLI